MRRPRDLTARPGRLRSSPSNGPRLTVLRNLGGLVRDAEGLPLALSCHVGYVARRGGEQVHHLIVRLLARLSRCEPSITLAGRLARALEEQLEATPVGVVIESRRVAGSRRPSLITTSLRGCPPARRAEFLTMVLPSSLKKRIGRAVEEG